MDVIPLDANLVKGSHGSPFCEETYYPLYIADNQSTDNMEPTEVYSLIWDTVFV
jgi:hypothetical protein